MIKVHIEDFGNLPTSDEVIKKFILRNSNNIEVILTNYGATLIAVLCPDRNGVFDDILLGFDDLQGYLDNSYFGSTIGRFANRIFKGQFTLDEKKYQLACNNGENHLHGGMKGFDKHVWSWTEVEGGIKFSLISEHDDENYPGELQVSSTYTLSNENELKMQLSAQLVNGDATLVNLTNHAFINLAGQKRFSDILSHKLQLNSDKYTPHINFQMTGEICDVDPKFDFTEPKTIGQNINEVVGGYDHNYCLNDGETFCARVFHEESGRQLEIHTNQPGVQFYSGNFLDTVGKQGNVYKKHTGFCLEPQAYPDNINQPTFPSSVLRKGERYEKQIIWKFSVK